MSDRTRLAVSAGTGACFLSVGLLIPVLPQYVTGPLHHGSAMVGVLVATPGVTGLLARPIVGRITDAHGPRWTALAGAAMLAAATFAMLVAHSFPTALACRAAAGIGEAFAYVGLATASISAARKPADTGGGVAGFSIAVYVGLLAGAASGAAVLRDLGFVWVWLLSGSLAGVAMVSCLLLKPRGPVQTSPGPLTSTSTTASSRKSGTRTGRRERSPLIHRSGLIPGIAYGASIWGYTAFNTYMPLYGQHVGVRNVLREYILYGISLLAIRILAHRLIGRIPSRRVAAASLAFTSAGLICLLVLSAMPGLVAGTMVLGVGQALGLPAFLTMAVEPVPAGEHGSVIATVTGFFDAGFLTAALALGLVIQTLGVVTAFAFTAGVAAMPLLLFVPWHQAVSPAATSPRPVTEE